MPGTPTPKWGLVPSAGTDQAMTIDNQQATTYGVIDGLLAPWTKGLLSARPVSTVGSPGKQGRRYLATDVGTWGCEYVDTGTSWRPTADTVKLAEVLLGSTGAITFSSIPQGFRHLRVEGYLRSSRAGVAETGAVVVINGNTSALYQHTGLLMQAASLGSTGGSGETSAYIGQVAAATAIASAYSGVVVDIPMYSASALKGLQARTSGSMTGGYKECIGGAELTATAAITSLAFNDDVSGGFATASCLTLYGIS